MDRAIASGAIGREFESLRAHHKFPDPSTGSGFRLRAPAPLTPARRLKFESLRAHQFSTRFPRCLRPSTTQDFCCGFLLAPACKTTLVAAPSLFNSAPTAQMSTSGPRWFGGVTRSESRARVHFWQVSGQVRVTKVPSPEPYAANIILGFQLPHEVAF